MSIVKPAFMFLAREASQLSKSCFNSFLAFWSFMSNFTMMRNLNKFLVLGLLVAAALFTTGMVNTISLQQADAVSCDRSVVAVCDVWVNANVIGQDVSQRCNQ
jgi:hypothetical protein